MAMYAQGIDALKRSSQWFVILGAICMAAGLLAVIYSLAATIASVVLFGYLLLFTGAISVLHAFQCKEWSGSFIDMVSGLLYGVVGLSMILHPVEGAMTLTILIAVALLVGGAFKMAVAVMHRYHNWGWLFVSGALNFALGAMIYGQWPVSGLWVIGLFLGLDMLMNGWWLLMLGLAAKRISTSST